MSSRRAILLLLVTVSGVRSVLAQRPPDSPDQRVEALLRRMTIEEKVGEMTQLDSAKLEEIVVNRNVGSLLNVNGVALTPRQWIDLTTTIQRFAGRKRMRIPVIYGIDAVHGHHYMLGATVFPQDLAMAATWNPMLVRRANEITSYET